MAVNGNITIRAKSADPITWQIVNSADQNITLPSSVPVIMTAKNIDTKSVVTFTNTGSTPLISHTTSGEITFSLTNSTFETKGVYEFYFNYIQNGNHYVPEEKNYFLKVIESFS